MTTFKKYQGAWCVEGTTDQISEGAEVEVTKRNGSTTTVTVDQILYTAPAPSSYVLASIISDRPTMTTRERKEARADRLRDWADSREAKSETAYEKSKQLADMIPFGQPILVGHHSEGRARRDAERIHSGMAQSVEHSRKADDMRSRADEIERQLDRSIYSDDADAVEKLREKLADLEGQRERIKAYNASCRKGTPDLSLLDEKQRADLASTAKHSPYFIGDKGQFPDYALKNLGGNITRNRKRLAQLERRAS